MAAYVNIGDVAVQFNCAHLDPISRRVEPSQDDGGPPVAFDAALVRRTPFDLRA